MGTVNPAMVDEGFLSWLRLLLPWESLWPLIAAFMLVGSSYAAQ